MKKTRVIILNNEYNDGKLMSIFSLLVGYGSIDPETVASKIREFREGKDFYYDIPDEKLEILLKMLTSENFKFETKPLE